MMDNGISIGQIDSGQNDVVANSQEIITDLEFLETPCKSCQFTEKAVIENKRITAELIATVQANSATCFSLSANQIGYSKAIFVLNTGWNAETSEDIFDIFVNPKLYHLKSEGMRKFKESCLSFPDTLNKPNVLRRYKKVKLFYKDIYGNPEKKIFSGKEAVIIQHEMDHINGVIRC